jgi:hypothetical protein
MNAFDAPPSGLTAPPAYHETDPAQTADDEIETNDQIDDTPFVPPWQQWTEQPVNEDTPSDDPWDESNQSIEVIRHHCSRRILWNDTRGNRVTVALTSETHLPPAKRTQWTQWVEPNDRQLFFQWKQAGDLWKQLLHLHGFKLTKRHLPTFISVLAPLVPSGETLDVTWRPMTGVANLALLALEEWERRNPHTGGRMTTAFQGHPDEVTSVAHLFPSLTDYHLRLRPNEGYERLNLRVSPFKATWQEAHPPMRPRRIGSLPRGMCVHFEVGPATWQALNAQMEAKGVL